MIITIVDCYTDEPAGLGVPPYIGTYPRYIYGSILESKNTGYYITIDDLRAFFSDKYAGTKKEINQLNETRMKTDIKIRNLSQNFNSLSKILEKTDVFIIISGINTPGKYLSALPSTLKEITSYVSKLGGIKILTGPAAKVGTGLYGGNIASEIKDGVFDYIIEDIEIKLSSLIKSDFKDVYVNFTYDKIKKISLLGAQVVNQYPHKDFLIAEIEASKGCSRKTGCSFCTEPLKQRVENRDAKDIIDEIKHLNKEGITNFRIGKQSDLFSYPDMEKLLKGASKYSNILHIDNINPTSVTEEKVKAVVKYCSEGNIAAMGQESFDEAVIKANNLNGDPESTYNAIKIMNKYGAERGLSGMPKFLPGINIIFGLDKESKKTHEANMFWLTKFLDEDLLIRRINVRQVVIFPGTPLFDSVKTKYLKKNKKYYWKWRNDIRQNVDYPMLKKLVPKGTILKGIRTEIHDGNTTFGRQMGTYPLIAGIKEKLALDKTIDIEVVDHMLRSIVGKKIK